MKLLTGTVVVAFALFLLTLAATIYARPERAARFLQAFAQSARAHYVEQVARLVIGSSLVSYASEMSQPEVFRLFGWVVIVTTLGLLCIPWRWHRRFAEWVVPPVVRYMKLYGIGAAALGLLVLYGVWNPGAGGAL